MLRHEREALEAQVQRLERANPSWNAAQLEGELATIVPTAYSAWKEETPIRRSRLRAIQRWRTGARGRDAGKTSAHLFPYLWPVGERQRKEVDPTFDPSPVVAAGSWRLFLYNCGPEIVRDVRVALDGAAVDYAPSIVTGRFTEVHWQRLDRVKAMALSGDGGLARFELRVDFVIARGTRQSRLVGELVLHPQQGWVHFGGRDGRAREVE